MKPVISSEILHLVHFYDMSSRKIGLPYMCELRQQKSFKVGALTLMLKPVLTSGDVVFGAGGKMLSLTLESQTLTVILRLTLPFPPS